ncbi:Aste57867_5133 [Aphanomyces stellatus]|uniref:Aste57867_5133 protein n=1 Tax=Aphanomyces stellatus TaxID=120398 RepID=A0A485KF23_9STRA|nr:hypothetical protein As57867_005120 [Aphanomyces stellatus]VFT82213.1 Aste57867_5133 [Aphanomyces stellatus]
MSSQDPPSCSVRADPWYCHDSPAAPPGGLFLNANTTPVYFKWLAYLSPLKYGFRGMSRAFWKSLPTLECPAVGPCGAMTGHQVLVNNALDGDPMLIDIYSLLAVNVLFRTIGILWLWLNIR